MHAFAVAPVVGVIVADLPPKQKKAKPSTAANGHTFSEPENDLDAEIPNMSFFRMKEYQRQTWADHLATLQFRQGEHILVSGPTSAGKTTFSVRGPIETRSRRCIVHEIERPHDQQRLQRL